MSPVLVLLIVPVPHVMCQSSISNWRHELLALFIYESRAKNLCRWSADVAVPLLYLWPVEQARYAIILFQMMYCCTSTVVQAAAQTAAGLTI